MKIFYISSLFALFVSTSAMAEYCTVENWDRGQALYNKYKERFYLQQSNYNDLLETYNEFRFTHRVLTSTTIDNEEAFNALKHNGTLAKEEARKFKKIEDSIKTIKSGFEKSRSLWDKLAEYCYDEDSYKDYKNSRRNMRSVIENIDVTEDFISLTAEKRQKYLKEVDFISTLTLKKAQTVFKGQELTCNEASKKTKLVEVQYDTEVVVSENFYISRHHTNNDHSLLTKKEPLAITTIYDTKYLTTASDLETAFEVLTKLVYTMEGIANGQIAYLTVPKKDRRFIIEWANFTDVDLPIEINEQTLSTDIQLTVEQANNFRDQASESRMFIKSKIKRFVAKLVKNNQNDNIVFFYFDEDCDTNEGERQLTLTVNEKATPYTTYCWASTVPLENYRVAIPSTLESMDYLVSEFKKKTWVNVELNNENKPITVKLWANGFTRSWNKLNQASQ